MFYDMELLVNVLRHGMRHFGESANYPKSWLSRHFGAKSSSKEELEHLHPLLEWIVKKRIHQISSSCTKVAGDPTFWVIGNKARREAKWIGTIWFSRRLDEKKLKSDDLGNTVLHGKPPLQRRVP